MHLTKHLLSAGIVCLTLGCGDSSHTYTPGAPYVVCGAVTPTSARVIAQVMEPQKGARLMVGATSGGEPVRYFQPTRPSATAPDNLLAFELTGLTPGTEYRYEVRVESVIDLSQAGRFKTFIQGPMSFLMAFGACAETGSDHPVFDAIGKLRPDFFFHLGDLHYSNITINNPNAYRQAYEKVFTSPAQSRLYRSLPLAYIWDDHDFGADHADRTAPGRTAAAQTFRECVPHYALVEATGDSAIYFAFSVGRVRFVVTDLRSYRDSLNAPDGPQKTMLGPRQKGWLKNELVSGKDRYGLLVWVNTVSWIGDTGHDGWYRYADERAELSQFIAASRIDNLCMISGDEHHLSIDDGTNSDYSGSGGAAFPVMQAAPLDRDSSSAGGPFSHGAHAGRGQFGLMSVQDTGESITVYWGGLNYLGEELLSYSFQVPRSPDTSQAP
jgi:phosphodiesterase/alkaline phosphatase D-like protein